MNLDYYIKKRHIFKARSLSEPTVCNYQNRNIIHIYSPRKFRLDFVTIRFFKKIFRRRFIKAKLRFFKPKFWIKLLPNYILTQKSKNARMGAGVGKLVRLTTIVFPGKSILKTWHYTPSFLRKVLKMVKTCKIFVKIIFYEILCLSTNF